MPRKEFHGTSTEYSQYLKDKLAKATGRTLADALRYLHWEQGLTILEITQQYGPSRITITRWMDELGIPRRTQAETTRMKMAALSPEERQKRVQAFHQKAQADGWSKHKSNHLKGPDNPMYNRITRICRECGKEEMVPPILRLRPFCSKACFVKWQRKNMFNPNYKRHFTRRTTRRQIPVKLRALVLERQRGRCLLCQRKRKKIHIHHIQAVADGGQDTLDNLVLLCQRCHIWFHKGLISVPSWQLFLL